MRTHGVMDQYVGAGRGQSQKTLQDRLLTRGAAGYHMFHLRKAQLESTSLTKGNILWTHSENDSLNAFSFLKDIQCMKQQFPPITHGQKLLFDGGSHTAA